MDNAAKISTMTNIVLDPLTADTMFIAVRYGDFYKSTDGGDTSKLLPGAPTGATVDFPKMAIGRTGIYTNNFIVHEDGDSRPKQHRRRHTFRRHTRNSWDLLPRPV